MQKSSPFFFSSYNGSRHQFLKVYVLFLVIRHNYFFSSLSCIFFLALILFHYTYPGIKEKKHRKVRNKTTFPNLRDCSFSFFYYPEESSISTVAFCSNSYDFYDSTISIFSSLPDEVNDSSIFFTVT